MAFLAVASLYVSPLQTVRAALKTTICLKEQKRLSGRETLEACFLWVSHV